MKRKAGEGSVDSEHGADTQPRDSPAHRPRQVRQPQTSCDFCRIKKLKCDRGKPCSTCFTRRQPCNGPPVPFQTRLGTTTTTTTLVSTSRVPSGHEQSILDRLRSLEEAVFGVSRRQQQTGRVDSGNELALTSANQSGPSVSDAGQHSDNTQLSQPDYLTVCDLASVRVADCNIKFCFAQQSRLSRNRYAPGQLSDDLPDQAQLQGQAKYIWLSSQDGSRALLHDYVRFQHLFLGVIDPRMTRDLVDHIYINLPHGKSPSLADVALLLSIAATTAFFWDKDDDSLSYRFSSEADAANWSVIWRNSAWDLLDQLWREIGRSLEELQATVILKHLISQIEGCPSRYRRLQGNALTLAREMSLHLIDAPGAAISRRIQPESDGRLDRHTANDSEAAKEVKRRVWWHLAGTDWLLSVMGGPLYKTYTINPLHMKVRYPRNINDSELQALTPWPQGSPNEWPDTKIEPPTDSTFALLRLRVGEICYEIVDAMQPIAYSQSGNGGDGIEQLSYQEVDRISQLFDGVLASFPPSYMLGAPIPPGSPPNLDMQRQTILLYFHARRARAFRSFLHSSIRDPRYDKFASLCRYSARTVLTIASSMMTNNDSNHHVPAPGRVNGSKIVHRSGLILMHLFMACIIVAADPTLAKGPSAGSNTENGIESSDAAARRTELAQACYILKQAAQKSEMASGLVESLSGVLKRHKLRMFCNKGRPNCEPQPSDSNLDCETTKSKMASIQSEQTSSSRIESFPRNIMAANFDERHAVDGIWALDEIEARIRGRSSRTQPEVEAHQIEMQSSPQSTMLMAAPESQPRENDMCYQTHGGQFPSPPDADRLPLDSFWNDLADAAATGSGYMTPGVDGGGQDGIQWEQLFADLDYFVGPS